MICARPTADRASKSWSPTGRVAAAESSDLATGRKPGQLKCRQAWVPNPYPRHELARVGTQTRGLRFRVRDEPRAFGRIDVGPLAAAHRRPPVAPSLVLPREATRRASTSRGRRAGAGRWPRGSAGVARAASDQGTRAWRPDRVDGASERPGLIDVRAALALYPRRPRELEALMRTGASPSPARTTAAGSGSKKAIVAPSRGP